MAQGPEMIQAFIHLIDNAIDANLGKTDAWIRLQSEKTSSAIQISITDSGQGIRSEIAEQMMKPFFSTKKANTRLGLGLSISETLAKDHGGLLRLDSSKKNTCFILELPILENPQGPEIGLDL
jgi:C4-dicarboxylate-specific signal transduction histidine kinase